MEKTTTQQFCSSKCRSALNSKMWANRNKASCQNCKKPIKHSSTLCKSCESGTNLCKLKTIGDCKTSAQIRGFNRSWNKELTLLPCQFCGYSLHVELAHIKPISSFKKSDLLSVVNDPTNILVLCKNHHWEQEHGILLLSDIPKRQPLRGDSNSHRTA